MEIVEGKKPALPDLHWGQIGLFYKALRPVGDPDMTRAEYGMIVGFAYDTRGKYRVYLPDRQRVLVRGQVQPVPAPPPAWNWPKRSGYQPVNLNDYAYSQNKSIQDPNPQGPVSNGSDTRATSEPLQPSSSMHAPALGNAPPSNSTPFVNRELDEPTVIASSPITANQESTPPPSEDDREDFEPRYWSRVPPSPTATETPSTTADPPVATQSILSQPTHNKRVSKPVARFADDYSKIYSTSIGQEAVADPLSAYQTSLTAAIANPDTEQTARDAAYAEFDKMRDYDVLHPLKFSQLTSDDKQQALRLHMFVKDKEIDNKLSIKARLVAGKDRYSNTNDFDVASPTGISTVIFTLLAAAAARSWCVGTSDFVSAFLNAKVEGVPPIYTYIDGLTARLLCDHTPKLKDFMDRNGRVYFRLNKYLYGLRQSPLEFYKVLKAALESMGFKQSKLDKCLFTHTINKSNNKIHVVCHVDDILVVTPRREDLEDFFTALAKHFKLTKHILTPNDPLMYLGIEISMCKYPSASGNTPGIQLSQYKFTQSILTKYGFMDYSKSTASSLAVGYIADKLALQDDVKSNYVSLVMTLMYLARFTRPDILFAVTELCTHCTNPLGNDLSRAKQVLRYLRRSPDLKVTYLRGPIDLKAYVDASHATHSDGKGHGGIILTIGSGPIYTRSWKLKHATLSSTDSELSAVCESVTLILWMRGLFKELGLPLNGPTTIYQDNRSAITMNNTGSGTFKRSKYLLVKDVFVKEHIDNKAIALEHISTKLMLADILTKSMDTSTRSYITNLLYMD
jgi:hypothetical protein